MRFAWARRPHRTSDPIDGLVRRTRSRLALVTLLLVALLLLGVGVVTAAVAIQAEDASVDRSLRDAAAAALATLAGEQNENENQSPAPGSTDSPTIDADDQSPLPTEGEAPTETPATAPSEIPSEAPAPTELTPPTPSSNESDDPGETTRPNQTGGDNDGSETESSAPVAAPPEAAVEVTPPVAETAAPGPARPTPENPPRLTEATPTPAAPASEGAVPTEPPALAPANGAVASPEPSPTPSDTGMDSVTDALGGSSPDASPNPSGSANIGGVTLGSEDQPPASSDTFFLVLDRFGAVSLNPRRVALVGLPNEDAVAAARRNPNHEDLRTVVAGGITVRLLTQVVRNPIDANDAFLQSGFVMTLHDEETAQLLTTILAASLVGLLGAAVVTLLVTRRALVPVRAAFATERQFVAAASHELRTPVAVIRASAEILEREDLVAPEGKTLVEDVISESDRLARLVGDLLALASAEAGAMSIDKQPIDLRAFVSDLGRRADSMAQARGVQLVVEQAGPGSERPLPVQADPDRLTQMLLILIDNAVDHSPDDATVRLVVRKVTNSHGQAAEVSVIDRGPGVPEPERERIFEPFARLASRHRPDAGTGLGLAIARLLANRHGASLRVADAAGGGAEFTVSLPVT